MVLVSAPFFRSAFDILQIDIFFIDVGYTQMTAWLTPRPVPYTSVRLEGGVLHGAGCGVGRVRFDEVSYKKDSYYLFDASSRLYLCICRSLVNFRSI